MNNPPQAVAVTFPKVDKNWRRQSELPRWQRDHLCVWSVFASTANAGIADQYSNNHQLNELSPVKEHVDACKEDYQKFLKTVTDLTCQQFQSVMIKEAVQLGITSYKSEGVTRLISDNFSYLATAIGQQVEASIDSADSAPLIDTLRIIAKLLYDTTYGTSGEAWKSQIVFDNLPKVIRGRIKRFNVVASNPLANPMTKGYDKAREPLVKLLRESLGIVVLKQNNSVTRNNGERYYIVPLDKFFVRFDKNSEKGMMAYALFLTTGDSSRIREKAIILLNEAEKLVASLPLAEGYQSLLFSLSNCRKQLQTNESVPNTIGEYNILALLLLL